MPKKKSKSRLRLLPAEGKSAEELRWDIEGRPKLPLSDAERESLKKQQPFQFSVGEIALLITIVALCLSGYSWIPFAFYTAICGAVSLLALLACNVWTEGFFGRFSRMLLAVVLSTYMVCCIVWVATGMAQ